MAFNWGAFVMKVPDLIKGGVAIAQRFKKPGPQKKADVIKEIIAAVPDGIVLVESGIDKDVFNDPAIVLLLSTAVDAERAAQKAHEALQAGLLAKAAAAGGPPAG
jgi:hypothetical protein